MLFFANFLRAYAEHCTSVLTGYRRTYRWLPLREFHGTLLSVLVELKCEERIIDDS